MRKSRDIELDCNCLLARFGHTTMIIRIYAIETQDGDMSWNQKHANQYVFPKYDVTSNRIQILAMFSLNFCIIKRKASAVIFSS